MNERSGRKNVNRLQTKIQSPRDNWRFETGEKNTEEKWSKSKVGLMRNQE